MKRIAVIMCSLFLSLFIINSFSQPNETKHTINGTISNLNNQVLSSIWVLLYTNNTIVNKTATSDDGQYLIEEVNPGKYRIYFTRYVDLTSVIDSAEITITKDTVLNFKINYEKPKGKF